MEYGASDHHKKERQVRIVTERGEVLDRRIATTRERFTAVFEGRRPMRILLEASTETLLVNRDRAVRAVRLSHDRPAADRQRPQVSDVHLLWLPPNRPSGVSERPHPCRDP